MTPALYEPATARIVQTVVDWNDVVRAVRASVHPASGEPVFAFDTETVDFGYPCTYLTGFSLAWFDGDGEIHKAYIPIGHATGETQLPFADVLDGLRLLLEHGTHEVVMHNAKYDVKVASVLGLAMTKRLFDTMIASWFLNTNGVGPTKAVLEGFGSHGLKDLSKYILHETMTSLKEISSFEVRPHPLTGKPARILATDKTDVVTMGEYAADDTAKTLRLWMEFKPKLLAEPRIWKMFNEVEREFVLCLADVEMFGIEVDTELLADQNAYVEAELVKATGQLYDARPEEDFPEQDPAAVLALAEAYDHLEAAYELPKEDIRYPRNAKGLPAGKGIMRKKLFEESPFAAMPWRGKLEAKIRDDKQRAEVKRFPHLVHKIFALGSNNDLNRVLFEEAYFQPIGELGANGLWSTKAENVEEWASGSNDVLATALLRYRKLSKLQGTYLIGMADKVVVGRLHTSFHRIGTRTGRLSSSDPNLQNIPTMTEVAIRKAFVATGCSNATVTPLATDAKGKVVSYEVRNGGGYYVIDNGRVSEWGGENPPWVLSVGDYSQLEIRLLAHVSNDATLVQAVLANEDIHAMTAQACFPHIIPAHLTLKEVKDQFPDLRGQSKPINFGVIYGMGPGKLAKDLGITEDEAREIIDDRYMSKYPGVKQYIDDTHTMAKRDGYVVTALGRKRHLPAAQLKRERGNAPLISKACRQAQNAPIQGLAADVVGLAMRNIRREFLDRKWWGTQARTLLQVHDELVQEFHPSVANEALDESLRLMQSTMKLRVPLTVEAALGVNWMETKH